MKVNIIKKWVTKNNHKAYLTAYMGHINGYVIPTNNKLKTNKLHFYISVYNIEQVPDQNIINIQKAINDIEVHGGLTYYGKDLFNKYAFGFDTAHAGDKMNLDFQLKYIDIMNKDELKQLFKIYEIQEKLPIETNTWKDMDFCTSECEKLSKQIKEIEDEI